MSLDVSPGLSRRRRRRRTWQFKVLSFSQHSSDSFSESNPPHSPWNFTFSGSTDFCNFWKERLTPTTTVATLNDHLRTKLFLSNMALLGSETTLAWIAFCCNNRIVEGSDKDNRVTKVINFVYFINCINFYCSLYETSGSSWISLTLKPTAQNQIMVGMSWIPPPIFCLSGLLL